MPALRVTQDNISQADGSVLHPRWKTGMVATMRVAFHIAEGGDGVSDYVPACGADLREMDDELALHLNALRQLTTTTQRLLWTPAGYGQQRMLDQVQVLSWPDPSYDGDEASQTFALETPFPYAEDATEQSQVIAAGTSGAAIVNVGNAAFSPVVRVTGPFLGFTLVNHTDLDPLGVPLEVLYDSTRPGALAVAGGHFAEIDFFRGTIYLDGSGVSLIAGIDPTLSDFWHLVPGSNTITISGAGATILWNNAWA